jgi:flagellar biogenesis protein FliO
MNEAAAELPGLGGSLALSFVSLGVVCLMAYGVLRWLSRRGLGRNDGPLRVVARCGLEPKRAIYLIEAAGRCFVVGVGEGPMALLAEVDARDLQERDAKLASIDSQTGWTAALARVLKRPADTGSSPK